MVCKPASSEIATKGIPRQILAAIKDQRAGQAVLMKSTLVSRRPSSISIQEMTENCGL
jgi:L-serine deaminase